MLPFELGEPFNSDEFYCDEEGDYVCDQSQAESIIQQAAADLQNALTEKAKAIIQQAKDARSELEKLKQEINWNKCRVHETEMELREAQKKAEHFEKHDMPAKYIQAFVRDATGFYAPGDKVFYVNDTYTRNECPFCKGTARINVQYNGETLSVADPHCKGNGYIAETHYEVIETEISGVYLKLCFEKHRAGYWNTDSVFIPGREYSIKPEHIFRTREEAEARAKELEAKTNAKK